ncbi:MAG: 4Fe-4S dicluster domain-containing protein [Promethearchaeota archaeon]|jgi:anaerobic dimethyl sulfoxide reductase subunit B (iron-sulfur subunit)
MTQYGFYIDQTRCIGCFTCAVACKDWHDIEAGPERWMRIQEIEKGKFPDLYWAFLPSACFHCADPSCQKACPVDAITKRESDGIVVVNKDSCLGKKKCGEKCLKACPWNAPQFGTEENAKMQKCDLCINRLENGKQTICVNACPVYALDVGELKELKKIYEHNNEAEGFKSSDALKPSVIFKPKLV